MNPAYNKYIRLVLIGLTILIAAFNPAEEYAVNACAQKPAVTIPDGSVSSAQDPNYKDAVITHHLHQNHFKRHRFNFDGCLPVQQDTVVSIVTGTYAVALFHQQHAPTPPTPSLRGPPATA